MLGGDWKPGAHVPAMWRRGRENVMESRGGKGIGEGEGKQGGEGMSIPIYLLHKHGRCHACNR